MKLYDSDSKAGKQDKEKAAENHAIVMGQNLNIAPRKEQFLWNVAFRHCLHSVAKFVFTFKTRFLFNGQKR
jgi:hypothetical protein